MNEHFIEGSEIHIGIEMELYNGRTVHQQPVRNKILLYGSEENPPVVFSFLSAVQIVLTQLVSVIWLPLLLTPFLCMMPADPIRVYVVSTAFLTAGITSVLQSTIGIRLPTIVTPSILFIGSLTSLLQEKYDPPCPSLGDLYAMGAKSRTKEWQNRMQVVQGAIAFSAGCQVILGFSGILGYLSKKITPVTIAPAIIVASLNVPQHISHIAKENGSLPIMVTVIIAVFALVLRTFSIPIPIFSVNKGLRTKRFPVFRMFPILSACIFLYIYFTIESTFSGPRLPVNKVVSYNEAVDNSKWFFLPVPFEWGLPTITLATVVHMIPTVILQAVLSVTTFHATALGCKIGLPTRTAVNRGIIVEGITSLIGSMWGHGLSSNIVNAGLFNITGVCSRTTVFLAAAILISISHFTRITAILANISPHILAALYIGLHVYVAAAGLSVLKLANLSSIRNCGIIGLSLFLGMNVPAAVLSNVGIFNTGKHELNTVITECLSSALLVSSMTASILDAIIPGRARDKNVCNWRKKSEQEDRVYSLPSWQEFLCSFLEKIPCFDSSN